MILEDGTGQGYLAAVTAQNRISTASVTHLQIEHACELGDRYNLNTGDITLTSANESSVFYLKNNANNDLFCNSLIYNLGNSTNGSGDWLIDVYRNPTAGTLVSGATDIEMNSNQNFGSNKTLTVDAYVGSEGSTLTDGTKSISTRASSGGRIVVSLGSIILPKGSSLGVKITPPSGNTSVTVQVAAPCFIKTFED